MSMTPYINDDQKKVLHLARETYGDWNQIMVSVEELCELAAVCTKYPRYSSSEKAKKELKSSAIDEVADVLIVLDHIVNIFDLPETDIKSRVASKIMRLQNWLKTSDSMEQTTVDREVPKPNSEPSTKPQTKCTNCKHFTCAFECAACNHFSNYEERSPIPCGECVHKGDYKALLPICSVCVTSNGSLFHQKQHPVGEGKDVNAII